MEVLWTASLLQADKLDKEEGKKGGETEDVEKDEIDGEKLRNELERLKEGWVRKTGSLSLHLAGNVACSPKDLQSHSKNPRQK